MARRSLVAVAGLALATGAMVVAGAGTAAADGAGADAVNIDAGAVTLSRPAVTPAASGDQSAQVCAEGTMRIDRSGARRIEHRDCSVTDVMGTSVTRAAAPAAPAAPAPTFGERVVPAVAAAAPASPAVSDYTVAAPVVAPLVEAETAQRLPVVVDPASASLPVTGGSVLPLAVGGFGALAMGAAGVVIARRRRAEVVAAG